MDIEATTKRFRLPGARVELHESQVHILDALLSGENVDVERSIGIGKTVCTLLAPRAVSGCKTALALVQPPLLNHFLDTYLKHRDEFYLPSIMVKDTPFTTVGAPVLYIISWTALSNYNAYDLLDRLAPDLVIFDESIFGLPPFTVRGARLRKYLIEQKPRTLIWKT